MAVGAIYAVDGSIGTGAYLTVQPAAGQECIVRNIYHAADITIERVGPAGTIVWATPTTDPQICAGAGILAAYDFHLNNTHYMKIKNDDGATKLIAVEGKETHIAD